MPKLSGTFMAVTSQTQQDSTKVCITALHTNSRLLVSLSPLFSAWWPLAPFQNRLYRPTAGSSLSILQQLALLFSATQQLQEGCNGFEGECGGLLSQTQCEQHANLRVNPPLLVWAAGPVQQRIWRRCLCISLPGTRMTALTDPRTNAKDMLGVLSLDITQPQTQCRASVCSQHTVLGNYKHFSAVFPQVFSKRIAFSVTW